MDEYRYAIAKITIEGVDGRGTGFLIAPDLVATALHVVADRRTEPPTFATGKIWLDFRGPRRTEAEIVPGKWNQDADCILLRCITPLPAHYPPVPLRELAKSGDLFRTRGYPDAQPINGMTWEGDVTSYTEELTNYYQTGSAPYGPVLQLFCKQAGSGCGAPPMGMSGAPVIVGTAAVGLLRFALMKGGRSVAATLYACGAKEIVALDPGRLSLRPPLTDLMILTSQQVSDFELILIRLFTKKMEHLRRIVRYSLGTDAEHSVSPDKVEREFVSTLVTLLMQQGPGMIGVLMRGLVTAYPSDGELRAFVRPISPYALKPLDDDNEHQRTHDEALIAGISRALMALAGLLPRTAELQSIVASYQPHFETTSNQIRVLARYKELHSVLHAIQKRLDEFTNNVQRLEAPREDIAQQAVPYLKEYAKVLRKLVKKARTQNEDLPTGEEETDWIDALDACATSVGAATEPTATVAESEEVLKVPGQLIRLLPNATRINRELVSAAKQVRLDNLAETMRSAEQELGPTMDVNTLQRLRDGSKAVGRLRARLSGLIAEHDEWQTLNSDFEYAKIQPQHQPPAKFASWPQFKSKIIGLCGAFPNETWSIDLLATMKQWPGDEPADEPKLVRNIQKLEIEFLSFYNQCIERFIDVDDELNSLCGKIGQLSPLLDALSQ